MEIERLLKAINNKLDNLTNIVTTGIDTMENYKYILGQINALEATKQEISNLQHDKELNGKSGTVIDLKRGLKDSPSK